VGVGDERVGALDPVQDTAVLLAHGEHAAVGAVDVQPDRVAELGDPPVTQVRDRRDGVDRGRRGGADGRDDRDRAVAEPDVLGDRASSASTSRRNASSVAMTRTPSRPSPSVIAAFSTDECACSEV
jgi:hypothetical protein